MKRTITVGLVGAGMFGGDVHLRTFSQLQQNGLLPWLGRLGLDDKARALGDIDVQFVALATRTEQTGKAKLAEYAPAGLHFKTYHGEEPWVSLLKDFPDLDVLAVATPDHLHAAPILAALERGVNVISEKPLTLDANEADAIIAAARKAGKLVGVDMHKRYDPDHLRIRDDLSKRIGTPLYGRAVLEEPLEISTKVFRKWAEQSDPFSYVGCHWTDLYIAYFKVKPVSLYAVGQKVKLRSEYGMDAFDAVQVKVTFDNGMSIDFINSWIIPDEFEAPVNQENQLFGTHGVIESDSQYRGLRYTESGVGVQTRNTHFTRDVKREDGSLAYVGYGVDSLVACIEKVAEMKYLGKSLDDLKGTYPDAVEGRLSVLIVHAAREVCRRNFAYTAQGKGAPVTACFGVDGITVYDPFSGPERIYTQPV
ncbi:MAG TPA: Gfo/Idh/MocA family oxidoreductase [Candidatus Hydrogenedentes bacterium]|nr:Gfo/Idh/MocA family oxidoreductase [Candidatus Hydrogenedentota bacterium]